MYGMRLPVHNDSFAAGLGIRLEHGGRYPKARFRLGLYEEGDDGLPTRRIATTGEMSTDAFEAGDRSVVSAFGGFEQVLAAPVPIAKGKHYWLFFIADDDLYVISESGSLPWMTVAQSYAGIVEMPLFANLLGRLETWTGNRAGDLYIVTTTHE
jgi:hypothetical protein